MTDPQTPATPAATPESTPSPQVPAQQTEWYGGFNDDLKGYVQNKGFKDPSMVVESYRNLEKLIGVKEKLVQVPDDLGSKDMDAVWNKLGRPEKPDGYGFKSEDAEFDKWTKDTFHKAGLTANQAKAVTDAWNENVKNMSAAESAKLLAENNAKIEGLKKDWGNAYEQNLNMAKQAAKQFGLDDKMVDSMEKSIGFSETMRFLNSIGAKVGEANYVSSNGGSQNGILTPSQAQSRINELKSDKEWSIKFLKGDAQAKREWESLNKMVVGEFGV